MSNISVVTLPEDVMVIREEGDLRLLHYTQDATHPGPTDFYKGVVTDSQNIVARSFGWAPTQVGYDLPPSLLYSRYHEATIVRFYKYNGQPMVSTHRQINIATKNSRAGTGRAFIDLAKDAIKAWPYSETTYEYQKGDTVGQGSAYTPLSWEDLCVEGWCHVFLLIDSSNQITDLDDFSEVISYNGPNGEEEVVFNGPQLMHIISFMQDGDLMVPFATLPAFNVAPDAEGNTQYTWVVPTVERVSYDDALTILSNGGAVVGYAPETPDVTVKFFSPSYARKVELAGETFNPIFRWSELMDRKQDDHRDARDYLDILPYHQKGHTFRTMQDIHFKYLTESTTYLADNIIQRVQGVTAPLDQTLYNHVREFYPQVTAKVKAFAIRRNPPTEEELHNFAVNEVAGELATLSFTK